MSVLYSFLLFSSRRLRRESAALAPDSQNLEIYTLSEGNLDIESFIEWAFWNWVGAGPLRFQVPVFLFS